MQKKLDGDWNEFSELNSRFATSVYEETKSTSYNYKHITKAELPETQAIECDEIDLSLVF